MMFALPVMVLLASADATDPAILGEWLTESGHGVIEIVRCDNAICGSIVGKGCMIGRSAVLNPGAVLGDKSVVTDFSIL